MGLYAELGRDDADNDRISCNKSRNVLLSREAVGENKMGQKIVANAPK